MNPLLLVHVAAGGAALFAGFGALALRKGGAMHARTGTIFFAAMLVMTSTGALIAALKPERGTMLVGILTFYLVATSWQAARRRDAAAGTFERVGALVAAGCALAQLSFGLIGANSPEGRFDSLPAAVHFVFAALAALALGLDLNFIRRGRLTAAQRIARHLWRMSTALLIAAFSFFLGQQDEFPAAVQGTFLPFVPPLAVLAAMIFWIFRVRFSRTLAAVAPGRRTVRPAAVAAEATPARA